MTGASQSNRFILAGLFCLGILAGLETPASADMGLPMLVVVLPRLGVLFLPIVLIEAFIGTRVTGLPFGKTWLPSLTANAITTLFGVPITWLIMLWAEMILAGMAPGYLDTPLWRLYAVTVGSPWLGPDEGNLHWMVPAACMSLCVPFCLMSIWIEGEVLAQNVERGLAKRWALIGNIATYAMIEVILLVLLLTAHP